MIDNENNPFSSTFEQEIEVVCADQGYLSG